MYVGNLHSVALIDLPALLVFVKGGWEPSFCSLDRLTAGAAYAGFVLGTFIL